jgi:hypothetical protein
MLKTHRVCNITRNVRLKFSQALKAVESCACAWVEEGVSIRDLSLAEAIAARNKQAQLRQALALAEIPGLRFQPPAYAQESTRREYQLAAEANKFAIECLP